jgi:hypothetical protein
MKFLIIRQSLRLQWSILVQQNVPVNMLKFENLTFIFLEHYFQRLG